jgi:hypothetical protein
MRKFLQNRIYKNRKKNEKKKLIHRIFGSLAIIPIIAIILGTYTIINGLSPEYLSSTSSLIEGFFDNFGGHAFILFGSFILTLIIWDLTHDLWDSRFH